MPGKKDFSSLKFHLKEESDYSKSSLFCLNNSDHALLLVRFFSWLFTSLKAIKCFGDTIGSFGRIGMP